MKIKEHHLELEINGKWMKCKLDTSTYIGILKYIITTCQQCNWRIMKTVGRYGGNERTNLFECIASGQGMLVEDDMDAVRLEVVR